jgi:hypothetical protein
LGERRSTLMVRPCQWLAHVQATKKEDIGTNAQKIRTIEMVVTAMTVQDAEVAANAKAVDIGYQPWGVKCTIMSDSTPSASVLALPAPTSAQNHPLMNTWNPAPKEKSEAEKLFENPRFFNAALPKPKYGGSITHVACTL